VDSLKITPVIILPFLLETYFLYSAIDVLIIPSMISKPFSPHGGLYIMIMQMISHSMTLRDGQKKKKRKKKPKWEEKDMKKKKRKKDLRPTRPNLIGPRYPFSLHTVKVTFLV